MLKVGSKRRRPPAEVKAERESKRKPGPDFEQQLAELQRFEAHLKQEEEKLKTCQSKRCLDIDEIAEGREPKFVEKHHDTW